MDKRLSPSTEVDIERDLEPVVLGAVVQPCADLDALTGATYCGNCCDANYIDAKCTAPSPWV